MERRAYAAPGSNGASATTWSVEAQEEFARIRDGFGGPFKSELLAAEGFRDAFLPFTQKYGFEVGANIVPGQGGLAIQDIILGGTSGVRIPYFEHATASIHTHPLGSGDGFSGTLRVVNGRFDDGGGFGDYPTMARNRISGYVYRAGDGAGWHFNQPAFHAALLTAKAAGTSTYAEWFTRRLP